METIERLALLEAENERLRAQLAEMNERHATIMRVVRLPGYTATQKLARLGIMLAATHKMEVTKNAN